MKSTKKRLSPSPNAAGYPTLAEAGHLRRLWLSGAGAAALAIGLSCTAGVAPPWDPPDASVATDGDVDLTDAALPAEDAGVDDPDGGSEGADT